MVRSKAGFARSPSMMPSSAWSRMRCPNSRNGNCHARSSYPSVHWARRPGWAMETNYAPDEVVADQDLIKSLPSHLVAFGSHTLTHPFLSRLPREAARAEIEKSRALLSAITGQDVRTISFPYGDYDQEVVAMCREAGYDMVFGIVPTTVDPRDGAFLRGRVAVSPDDSDLEFFLKMSGGYWWMSLASTLKQACLSPHTFLTGKRKASSQPSSGKTSAPVVGVAVNPDRGTSDDRLGRRAGWFPLPGSAFRHRTSGVQRLARDFLPKHMAASAQNINGVRIWYETYGSGPPVLLLHGGTGSLEDMREQIRALAATRLVVAVDSRGHGQVNRC